MDIFDSLKTTKRRNNQGFKAMDKGQELLDLLTGRTDHHVVIDQRVGLPVHQEVVPPLILLKEEAKKEKAKKEEEPGKSRGKRGG